MSDLPLKNTSRKRAISGITMGNSLHSNKYTSTWTIIRHGQTNCNINGIIQGQSIPAVLAENGRHQAKKLGKFLKTKPDEYSEFDVCYCSDLIRAKETALGLLGAYFLDEGRGDTESNSNSSASSGSLPSIQDCLKKPDQKYLDYLSDQSEKISRDHLKINFNQNIRERSFGEKEGHHRTTHSKNDPLPLNSESTKQVAARVGNFIAQIFSSEEIMTKKRDSKIMVVSHGGTIKIFMEQLLQKFEFLEGFENSETASRLQNGKVGIAPNTSRTVVRFHYEVTQDETERTKQQPNNKQGHKNLQETRGDKYSASKFPSKIKNLKFEVLKIYDVEHLE